MAVMRWRWYTTLMLRTWFSCWQKFLVNILSGFYHGTKCCKIGWVPAPSGVCRKFIQRTLTCLQWSAFHSRNLYFRQKRTGTDRGYFVDVSHIMRSILLLVGPFSVHLSRAFAELFEKISFYTEPRRFKDVCSLVGETSVTAAPIILFTTPSTYQCDCVSRIIRSIIIFASGCVIFRAFHLVRTNLRTECLRFIKPCFLVTREHRKNEQSVVP